CAALRLARFNAELEAEPSPGHDSFKGLPSPGAAGTVASLALLHEHFLAHLNVASYWLVDAAAIAMVAVMLLVAVAMVSSFPYVQVVSRSVRGRARIGTRAKAVMVARLLVVWPQAAFAGPFVLCALAAPMASAYRRVVRRSAAEPVDGGV